MKALWRRLCDWLMADDEPRMGWGCRAAFTRRAAAKPAQPIGFFVGTSQAPYMIGLWDDIPEHMTSVDPETLERRTFGTDRD